MGSYPWLANSYPPYRTRTSLPLIGKWVPMQMLRPDYTNPRALSSPFWSNVRAYHIHAYTYCVRIRSEHTYTKYILFSFDQESMAELSLSRYMARTRDILPIDFLLRYIERPSDANISYSLNYGLTFVLVSQPHLSLKLASADQDPRC